jgi:hypothetical protein
LVIGFQSAGDVVKHVSEIRAGLDTCLRFEDKVLEPMTSLLKRLLAAYPMREFSYAPGQVATLHSEPSPVINNFYGAVTTYIREKIEACTWVSDPNGRDLMRHLVRLHSMFTGVF